MLLTNREIRVACSVRVRVVRDVSCVRSCGRESCLRCRGVFRIRVLLLLLRLVESSFDDVPHGWRLPLCLRSQGLA